MNFTDFYKDLAKEHDGIDQKMAYNILCSLQKSMETKLKFGTEITFRNIGKFTLKVREPKKYLDFKTNKMVTSNRKYSLVFRVSRMMSKYLRGKTVYGYENSQKEKKDI